MLQKIITVEQLAQPHSHIKNTAERAVRTFKNNFMAVLASVDKKIPVYLWCRIVKQSEITIDLPITSRKIPRLSAYAQIFVTFYFNARPVSPPGTKIIAHKNQLNVPHGANTE